jgi:tetratricopeptide (TPR) repeat protein
MKKTVLRIMIILSVLVCINGYVSLRAEVRAADEVLPVGRVVYVDHERGFVIFDIGREQGVRKDTTFNVYQNATRIGEIKTVKVRTRFTAADIECSFKDTSIKIGDSVALFKPVEIKEARAGMEAEEEPGIGLLEREESILLEQAKGYFKEERYEQAMDKVDELLQLNAENKEALRILRKIDEIRLNEEVVKLLNKARIEFKVEAYELAEEKLNAALQLDPRNKEVLSLLDQVDEARLRKKTDSLFQEARESFEEKRYIEARDKIEDLLLPLEPEKERGRILLRKVEKAILTGQTGEIFIKARGYFEEMEFELAQEKVDEILELDPGNRDALNMQEQLEDRLRLIVGLDAESIIVDINAPMRSIFSTAREILEKYGCLITFSDSASYNLKASKYRKRSLFKRIIEEERPITRNKIYYTVELRPSQKSDILIVNRLVIHLKGVHDKEGQVRNYRIKKSSAAYKEAQEMVCSIKYLAESL